jgi:hypothetical protein
MNNAIATRYWTWPDDLDDINTYDGQMQYGIALWTNTQETIPTEAQIRYALALLKERAGADPDKVDWSTKHTLSQSIYRMTQLPVRKGAWARPGREV